MIVPQNYTPERQYHTWTNLSGFNNCRKVTSVFFDLLSLPEPIVLPHNTEFKMIHFSQLHDENYGCKLMQVWSDLSKLDLPVNRADICRLFHEFSSLQDRELGDGCL